MAHEFSMFTQRALVFLLIIALHLPFVHASAEDGGETAAEEATSSRTISVSVRDGTTVLWSGSVSVPDSDSATTSLTATDGTVAEASAASALAALVAADAIAPEFSISHLQYFDSFGSFYVKCITGTEEKCDSWQYIVGETYPSLGMDQYILHDGDSLFVYFGSPRRTTLSTTTIATGESFTATAERYVPASDTYAPASGVTLGVTQENPADPYTPLVIATSSADAAGQANFTLSATGTYAIGIAEDFYYPTAALTVTDLPAEPTPESPEVVQQSSGGGGSSAPPQREMDAAAALSFLTANQNPDGSFATPLLTDWAAIAFGATREQEPGEATLRAYLTEMRGFKSLTDYERHAMALMALGIDPYNGTEDYIETIVSYFDGEQFGEPSQVNDDIFALIPLQRAGYGAGDEMIARVASFIVSKQRSDGSWDASTDLTAAAIQALHPVRALPGVESTLTRATDYLHREQHSDGGFGNSFSTSWALQAIHALGENTAQWQPSNQSPQNHLSSAQAADGGLEATSDVRTRVWATAYAIPAVLEKPWHDILASFKKPIGSESDEATSPPAAPLSTTPTATTSVLALALNPALLPEIAPAYTEPVLAQRMATEPPATETQYAPDTPPRSQAAAAAATFENSPRAPENFFARAARWFGRIGTFFRTLLF